MKARRRSSDEGGPDSRSALRRLLALLVCAAVAAAVLVPSTAGAARYVVENWNPSTGDWHEDPGLDFIGWEQFNEDPELLSLHQDGSQGNGLYGHSDLSALSNGAVAEWRYTPPGISTVFKAEFEEATFDLAGCLNEGLRLKSGEWERTVNEGPPFQERHASYHPTACGVGVVESPVEGQLIVGDPGPQIFCAGAGEPEPCGRYDSPLENSAAFGIERFGVIQTPFSAYLRGIRVYETSYEKPYFTGSTNTIEGWVHTGTGTIAPTATDTGMGMKTIRLTSLNRGGGTDVKFQSSSCAGTRLARCPATWNEAEPAYSPSFPYGVDELPEGIDHFGLKAIDIVENYSLPDAAHYISGGDDETVVPPTKVDRTPPTNVAASGELFELANHYINGQGTRTVGLSATDSLSGIRSLSLEDEGHGVLATFRPPSCVLTPLREDQCPLQAGESLSVDTGQMPEGANHLRIVAEDLAGNDAYGEAWTVYVDRTPPVISEESPPIAISISGVENPVLVVSEATDPPLIDGSSGSGIAAYWYRYSLNSGAFSTWIEAPGSYLELPGATAGSKVTVEDYAVDRVGNVSETYTGSTTVIAEGDGEVPVSPSEGYEEEEEEPGQSIEFGATSRSASFGAAIHPQGTVQFREICRGDIPYPHFSTHAALAGERRVNAVLSILCTGNLPIVEGYGVNFLIFRGQVVAMSRLVPFGGILVYKKVPVNEPCREERGQYFAKGVVYALFPPGAIPIGEATGNPEVKIVRSKKVDNPCL